MSRVLRVGLFVLLLGPLAAAAAEVRQLLPAAEQARFAAVGRLNVRGAGYCTATLVAPDRVLTAAHCLVDRRTGEVVAAERLHFLAGFRAGKYSAHARAAEVEMSPGFEPDVRHVGRDLAVITLRAPVPDAVQPIPLHRQPRPEQRVMIVSYGIDRSQIASVERDCRLVRRTGPVLYTDCEGVPGVSGAPLLQIVDGRLAVVGIASAVVDPPPRVLPRGALVAVGVAGAAH